MNYLTKKVLSLPLLGSFWEEPKLWYARFSIPWCDPVRQDRDPKRTGTFRMIPHVLACAGTCEYIKNQSSVKAP